MLRTTRFARGLEQRSLVVCRRPAARDRQEYRSPLEQAACRPGQAACLPRRAVEPQPNSPHASDSKAAKRRWRVAQGGAEGGTQGGTLGEFTSIQGSPAKGDGKPAAISVALFRAPNDPNTYPGFRLRLHPGLFSSAASRLQNHSRGKFAHRPTNPSCCNTRTDSFVPATLRTVSPRISCAASAARNSTGGRCPDPCPIPASGRSSPVPKGVP